MPNLAKEARDKAQIAWPGASVSGRGKGWINHQHPTDASRFMLDTHIGPIHYGTADDTEIDTAWEPGVLADAPWLHKMVKSSFNVYMGPGTTDFDAGQIMRYVHPASGEDITFEAQQLQWTNDLDQIEAIADPQTVGHTSIDDDTIHWQGAYGAGLDFRWQAQTARLAKYLTIQSLTAIGSPPQFIIDGGNPVLRLPFIFQKSSGVDIYIDGVLWNEKSNNPQTTSGNVEFRLNGESLWWFKQATARDSSEDVKPSIIQQRFRAQAQNLFVEVLVPWTWLQSAVYPVVIDPTVDYQVGASSDDAREGATAVNLTETGATAVDQIDEYYGFRWTGVTIPDGATIDETSIDWVVVNGNNDEPYHTYWFEDGSNPGTFTTAASDISDRTATTATVIIDNANLGSGDDAWLSSLQTLPYPELKTIVQELVDSYDYSSGNAMVAILQGGVGGSNRDLMLRSYDYNTAMGAKLHIEYTAAGGSPYSLILAQGSYTQTGQTVDFKAARKMPVAQGSYTQTGQDVAFKTARKMPVAQGSYALTGQDVAFKAARKLTIEQGAYTLTGQAVGLLRGYMLALAQGSYTLTGQGVDFKAARKLALAHGTYALTGQSVAFKAARTLALAQGSYTLTGFAVGFKAARKIVIAQGSYTLTGQDVLFTYTPVGGPTYSLALAHGLYALTGQSVAFKAARKMALAHGVYNLTGQATSLTVARKLAIGQGSYALTGQAIDLIIARILALNYGGYSLIGQAVAFTYSGSVSTDYIFDGDVAIRLVADGIVAVRLVADGDVAIRLVADGEVEL